MSGSVLVPRRAFLAGTLAAASALALSGCQSLPHFTLDEAVRRLLLRSSDRAFARLTEPGGYWNEAVARAGLPQLLGTRGDALAEILTSAPVRSRLEGAFAEIAFDASARAAPVVADAVRMIGIANARALINGGPTAASAFLRGSMGTRLVDVLVPEIAEAIRVTQDPLVGELLAGLTGLDVSGLSGNLAASIEEAIWREIGAEEAAIRANPRGTGDPLLIGALAAGQAL